MKRRIFTYCLIGVFCLLGCSPEEDEIDDQLIAQQMETNITEYMKLVRFSCTESLLFDAERYVDSLMIEQIRYSITDTLYFPGRPIKPDFPYPIIFD